MVRRLPVQGGPFEFRWNWCIQIVDETKDMIQTIFNEDSKVALIIAATEDGVHLTATWILLK